MTHMLNAKHSVYVGGAKVSETTRFQFSLNLWFKPAFLIFCSIINPREKN